MRISRAAIACSRISRDVEIALDRYAVVAKVRLLGLEDGAGPVELVPGGLEGRLAVGTGVRVAVGRSADVSRRGFNRGCSVRANAAALEAELRPELVWNGDVACASLRRVYLWMAVAYVDAH